jgi:hypothetical protein
MSRPTRPAPRQTTAPSAPALGMTRSTSSSSLAPRPAPAAPAPRAVDIAAELRLMVKDEWAQARQSADALESFGRRFVVQEVSTWYPN